MKLLFYFNKAITDLLLAKSTFILVPIILFSEMSAGQSPARISRHTSPCNCKVHPIDGQISSLRQPNKDIEILFDKVLESAVLDKYNFHICYAFMDKLTGKAARVDGKNFTYVHPYRLDLNNPYSLRNVFIIAHEIGHLVNNHYEDNRRSQHDQELAAHRFAGSILYKWSATIQDVEEIIKELTDESFKSEVRRGYHEGNKQYMIDSISDKKEGTKKD